jgi:hypothetical protein
MHDPDYIIMTALVSFAPHTKRASNVLDGGQVKKRDFTRFLTALSVDTLYATTPSL